MDKVLLPLGEEPFATFVQDVIERRLGITDDYTIVGDNFYKHSSSYFPHCDAIESNAWLNIVIPIRLTGAFAPQKFIVFDQTWTGKNITWLGNYELTGDFHSNKKTNDRPCDGEFFAGATGLELPDDVWNHMEHRYFDRNYFHSMSGTAYTWAPGNAIVFDSQHIHATGRMQSFSKLGLSVRIATK